MPLSALPLDDWLAEQGLDWRGFAIAMLEGEAPEVNRYAGRYWVQPAAHLLWSRGTHRRPSRAQAGGAAEAEGSL